jgi:hypothetical protein
MSTHAHTHTHALSCEHTPHTHTRTRTRTLQHHPEGRPHDAFRHWAPMCQDGTPDSACVHGTCGSALPPPHAHTHHSSRCCVRAAAVAAVLCICLLQFTRQRSSKPDWGLREAILLPWYTELAAQYLARPYGAPWTGNSTLLASYEQRAWVRSGFTHALPLREPLAIAFALLLVHGC